MVVLFFTVPGGWVLPLSLTVFNIYWHVQESVTSDLLISGLLNKTQVWDSGSTQGNKTCFRCLSFVLTLEISVIWKGSLSPDPAVPHSSVECLAYFISLFWLRPRLYCSGSYFQQKIAFKHSGACHTWKARYFYFFQICEDKNIWNRNMTVVVLFLLDV